MIVDDAEKVLDHQDVFGVLLQQVGTTGEIRPGALIAELKSRKGIDSVAADFMALVLLTAPGKTGRGYCLWLSPAFRRADGLRRPARGVLWREKMNLNVPCQAELSAYRKMPPVTPRCAWRCRPASSISAAKANSNICTSQVLLANIASLYAVFHGPAGLKRIASRIHRLADILACGLQQKVSDCVMSTTSTPCASR